MTDLLPTYRAIGGVNNNLTAPMQAAVGAPELAITPPSFGSTAALTDAPNARMISNVVTGATNDPLASSDTPDQTASAWLYAFGQFIDHDLDLEKVGKTDISIPVPNGDPKFPAGTMIPITRAETDPTTGTLINTVAGYLDLSQVYGSDLTTANSLRNADGTMKTSAGDALPIKPGTPPPVPGAGADPTPDSFVAGDARVNENPELTAITTMFVREHNYWVGQLAGQHPDWTGDQLYNMAKAITTAEYQKVIYSEFLPSLLGPHAIPRYQGYDPHVNAQVTQEFATAAFRVGHSQVSDEQTQIDNSGNQLKSQTLAQSFANTPMQTMTNDGISALLRNLSSEASQAVDVYAVDGLRNLLAAAPDEIDLIAIDIQRERDVGIGTLNQTRTALGLKPYTSFDQVTSDPTVQQNLQTAYGSIDKLDLFIGGIAEDHVDGSDVGPTFQVIIAKQFQALRDGDRFYWQNQNFDAQTKQLISQTKLSDIIERTTGTMAEQPNVFTTAERHMSNVTPEEPDDAQLVIGADDAKTIAGGPGDDTIVAGWDSDQVLTGSGGADVFILDGSGRTATISDFNPASDKIEFQDDWSTPFHEDASVKVSDFGNAVVQHNGNTVTLDHVSAASLSSDNFMLPPGLIASLDAM